MDSGSGAVGFGDVGSGGDFGSGVELGRAIGASNSNSTLLPEHLSDLSGAVGFSVLTMCTLSGCAFLTRHWLRGLPERERRRVRREFESYNCQHLRRARAGAEAGHQCPAAARRHCRRALLDGVGRQ